MRVSAWVALLAVISATPVIAKGALSKTDRAAAFRAAGYKLKGGAWHGCDEGGLIWRYEPGEITLARDLNSDGRPDAVIVEGSLDCFGMTAVGYTIVSKQRNGRWSKITKGPGIPRFRKTNGANGWPDLEIGGPGFCFLVRRWNGEAYIPFRHQYEGKPCRPYQRPDGSNPVSR